MRAMPRSRDPRQRLARVLGDHQRLHDPLREPRNALRWLPELRRWQAERLRRGFAGFLDDPYRRPAAEFFLADLYGDRDFTRRDADIARVLPTMQGLLPEALLHTIADAIELGALTHALDLRMGEALEALAPRRKRLDDELYAQAYRRAGLRRQRMRQIALIDAVGRGLAAALALPGMRTLLRLSRLPAQAAGFGELQGFLERGVAAFSALDDADGFIREIVIRERELASRLFAADPDPFRA